MLTRSPSWESIASREYISGTVSHQLSATALLPSPSVSSRHPFELYDFRNDDFLGVNFRGRRGGPSRGTGLWDCLIACSRGFDHQIGKRRKHRCQQREPLNPRQPEFFQNTFHVRLSTHQEIRLKADIFTEDIPNGIIRVKGWVERSIYQLCWSERRSEIEQGWKLYNQHKQQAAVKKWMSALKKIRKRDDKFCLLGYLFHAYMDWGKYRDSTDFAQRQLIISEEMDNSNMRAEAYLNLALAHEKMGALERALIFARHSLYNECSQCRTAGLVYITVGCVYLEMANFCRSLSSFQHAYKIAMSLLDSRLELQVYIGLSELFGRLKDADKSAMFASKAYDISRSLQLGDLNTRHHRAALLQMATALCKQGELGDAHDYCGEATRFALVSGDQATYTRSIRILGDIYRKKSNINKAFRQYESAISTAVAMGDRLCQMQAMDGAAKCLETLRLKQKICNCRPLQFNIKLLEIANSVGAKMLVRTVRLRLSQIYGSLRDEEQQQLHETIAKNLEEEMELQCGACNLPLGLEADSLEALPCSHILHARCVYEILRRKDKKKKRACPDCHKSVGSRLYLYANNPATSCLGLHSNHSSLSLASLSLRESSLSLGQNATSSV